MCGIAGFYSLKGLFRKDQIGPMTDSVRHRGPDAEGEFFDSVCGLGHRRLSIIDLSERGSQPMFSSDKRYVIVYNGEVYNYNEIGAKLGMSQGDRKTVKLKSSSDTEVILEAFAANGPTFVHELNGMFAFAIYDTLNQELYIYRDRMGIKPLYFYWDGVNFAFASELKALKKLDQLSFEIDNEAINKFLHLGYVPAPLSIYKNIFKLKSGSWLKINKDGLEIMKYWNLTSKISNHVITETDQAMVKLSDLLISSVQYQLKSDVPFGVFLSGGIDSSLVTAQAVMLSSVKVNTFSIGFEENSHNESEYAKAVARYLGTSHHEFIISYKDALNLIDSITDTYDEPFSDSSCIPTMLVSKLAREYVTVTLSGEGGDELFLGYGAYKWAHYLNQPAVKALRKPAAALFSKMSSRYQRVGRLLNYDQNANVMSHIFSQEQYLFSESEVHQLLNPEFRSKMKEPSGNLFDSVLRSTNKKYAPGQISVSERKMKAIELQAIYDLENYLQDDLLTKVDRASMKYSLETRVPYLDHRMVEFALNISPDLKYHNGTFKYILKKVLYQYVPKQFFDRPKQGFAIPLNKWLKTSLKYLIDDYLSETVITKFNVVNYTEVKKLKDAFFNGHDFLYNRIWLIIVLHMWLIKNEK
ncbi:MAG: asparagine synthase (glutamine-hydrolyzing) [Bacteroidota bacterium]|nr:asparagine synthase (glutamine-hydrolyzing) [Bacteroidota bacterium]